MEQRRGLNANALKMIAIIAMTIDHVTWTFLPGYRTDPLTLALHMIGRLTAPIMMFFIVEGFYHTKNLKKYLFRMFLFAFIAHFPYALLFNKTFLPLQEAVIDQTSVMWAFAMGLSALAIARSENPRLKQWLKTVLVFVCLIAAFPANWSTPAALAILYMGNKRGDFRAQMWTLIISIAMYALVYAIFLDVVYGILQLGVALAIPLLRLYNGERGRWKGLKWGFYLYYPLHMAVLGLIRVFVLK